MFRVGLTVDFLRPDGRQAFPDIDLGPLDRAEGVEWHCLETGADEVPPEAAADYDALLVLGPRISAATLEDAGRLAVVARIGVGYDSVDVDACTRAGAALTITPDGVRRPVASAAMAFLLALAHRLPSKDRLTREGRWAERVDHMGLGLRGRTLGVVGLGNIGREVCRLCAPFEMTLLAADPVTGEETAAGLGARLVALPELLAEADFVLVCCALTEETRHLIGPAELGRMKPTAHLINVARGPIVDQAALTEALREGAIAGAAIDVFEEEPVDPADPILRLDNVIVAPHALAWTDESFRLMGESAFAGILAVSEGRAPGHVVNGEVLETESFRAKLAACARRRRGA
ncbi:MAG: hypothetical protein OXG13_05990 [Gemmatimonadaceae bacterium]|nr:hypothetical protein [Gemmatimonadaceae bacterium]